MSSPDNSQYKNYQNIKDKMKLFLSILRDFQNYLRFKSKRDEQLQIDYTQMSLIGEIISAENLKNLILSVESKYIKEKKQKTNNTENVAESVYNNNSIKRKRSLSMSEFHIRNNGTCFGQKGICSKNILFNTENEKNVVKQSIHQQLKSEIKNKIYSLLLSQDNNISTSSNFVLRNVTTKKNSKSPERRDILPTEITDKKDKIEMKNFSLTDRKNVIQRNFVQVGNVVDFIKYKSDYQDNKSRHYKIKNNVEKLKELYTNILSNKIYTSNGSLKFGKFKKIKGTLFDKDKQLDQNIRLIKLDYSKFLPKNEEGDQNSNFIKQNNFLNYNNINTLCRKKKEAKDKCNLTYSIEKNNDNNLPVLGKENDIYNTYSPGAGFRSKDRNTHYSSTWNRKKKNIDETRRKIKIALHYEYK
jgi:hypothetical protein